jgi:hypothetical protein
LTVEKKAPQGMRGFCVSTTMVSIFNHIMSIIVYSKGMVCVRYGILAAGILPDFSDIGMVIA